MVQRRAARWVTNRHHNTSSVTDMLHTLGWTSLEHRRATSRLCMLFQIYHSSIGMVMILISSHTDILHDPHVKQICTYTIATYQCRTNYFKCSFSPKQLLLGMPSLKVWSLAPHWMHSRRHCHWGDRYQASVFEPANLSCF